MKVFCFLILSLIAIVYAEDKYTTKYDNVNLEDILSSDRLLRNYVKCLKGIGKCTPDGAELKRLLPEALETECAKCSEKQREGSHKVISHLINKKPQLWKELEEKYDPTGKFRVKYEKEYRSLQA
uniref:Chemosensory protein 17 n=1 Tax=Chrysoperla nipponensis TaxID=413239 RepID=A0A0R8P0L7_CHRNP|nr:chemosensory protein 17 [Chrysoperla nipponensis]